MSHFGLEKFFKPKDGEKISIKILDEPPLSMGQHYIEPSRWDGLFDHPPGGCGRPDCESCKPKNKGWYWDRGLYLCDLPGDPKECTIGGPYDQNIQPTKRYHLPVIHEGEQKILAVNSVTMKKIAEEGRRLVEEMQARLLVESQRTAAARFKRSKTFYRAKR
jgi:hypothetical protein